MPDMAKYAKPISAAAGVLAVTLLFTSVVLDSYNMSTDVKRNAPDLRKAALICGIICGAVTCCTNTQTSLCAIAGTAAIIGTIILFNMTDKAGTVLNLSLELPVPQEPVRYQ